MFSLNGDQGLDILSAAAQTSVAISSDTAMATGTQQAITMAGKSALTFDPLTKPYQFKWGNAQELGGHLPAA